MNVVVTLSGKWNLEIQKVANQLILFDVFVVI